MISCDAYGHKEHVISIEVLTKTAIHIANMYVCVCVCGCVHEGVYVCTR